MWRLLPRTPRGLCGKVACPPALRYLREPILKTVTVVLIVLLSLQYAVNMVVTSRYRVGSHPRTTSISRRLTNHTNTDTGLSTVHTANMTRHILSQSALFNASMDMPYTTLPTPSHAYPTPTTKPPPDPHPTPTKKPPPDPHPTPNNTKPSHHRTSTNIPHTERTLPFRVKVLRHKVPIQRQIEQLYEQRQGVYLPRDLPRHWGESARDRPPTVLPIAPKTDLSNNIDKPVHVHKHVPHRQSQLTSLVHGLRDNLDDDEEEEDEDEEDGYIYEEGQIKEDNYNSEALEVPAALKKDTNTSADATFCPEKPPNLVGVVPVSFDMPTFTELEAEHPELLPGGRWRPLQCKPRHRVAIIIPYRDRQQHLRIFLAHIHPFLQKQLIEYTIFILEQNNHTRFNRAMLFNIGFVEANKLRKYDCAIFHDVDLLPEDDRNLYTCPDMPRHMSAAVDTFAYRLPYAGIFGGVAAIKNSQFIQVNGFSNMFFGWGGEDDDMYNRIQYHGLKIRRYPMHIARYKMIRHMKENPSPERFKYLNTGKMRFRSDGLQDLRYKVTDIQENRLCTTISVNIDESEVLRGHLVDEVPKGLQDATRDDGSSVYIIKNAADMRNLDPYILEQIRRKKQTLRNKWKHETLNEMRRDAEAKIYKHEYARRKSKGEMENRGPDGGFTILGSHDYDKAKNKSIILEKAMQRLLSNT